MYESGNINQHIQTEIGEVEIISFQKLFLLIFLLGSPGFSQSVTLTSFLKSLSFSRPQIDKIQSQGTPDEAALWIKNGGGKIARFRNLREATTRRIFTAYPNLFLKTFSEIDQISKFLSELKSLGFDYPTQLIEICPELLNLPDFEMAAKLQMLKGIVVKQRFKVIELYPQILLWTSDTLTLEDITNKILTLKLAGVQNPLALMSANPELLKLKLNGNFMDAAKTIQMFEWLQKIGVSDPQRIIKVFPNLIAMNPGNNLDTIVQWLRDQGLSNPAKVLERHPSLLGLSIEERLQPDFEWMRQIGITNPGRVFEKYTGFAAQSNRKAVSDLIDWLVRQGVKSPGAVLSANPEIAGMNIETLSAKVAALKVAGIINTGSFIENNPMTLSMSADKLEALLEHLQGAWGLSAQDIETEPMMINASVDRVKSLYGALVVLKLNPSIDFDLMQKRKLINEVSANHLLANFARLKLLPWGYQNIEDIPEPRRPSRDWMLSNYAKWTRSRTSRVVKNKCARTLESLKRGPREFELTN